VRLYRSMNIAYNMQAIQNLNRKTLDGKLTWHSWCERTIEELER
jgi:hypothetical protein